jgi:hypothetical protein
MEKVSTFGLMAKFTMVSGAAELKKDTVSGEEFSEIHILVNGRILRQMAMVFTSGKMEIAMKESGKTA